MLTAATGSYRRGTDLTVYITWSTPSEMAAQRSEQLAKKHRWTEIAIRTTPALTSALNMAAVIRRTCS
jgi:hypothetical protein